MSHRFLSLCLALVILVVSVEVASAAKKKVLKAGFIGLDTSHVIKFTKEFEDSSKDKLLDGVEIVAAFPGGSPDIEASWGRVKGFTEQLKGMGVDIVGSIEELCDKVDVVFLESVDGRPHLEQVKPVLAAGKPVFIDKPCAGNLADAIEIFELAKEKRVPVFSSSSLRFVPGTLKFRNNSPVGRIVGCDVRSPCATEPHHRDLAWYGIHGVEILFTIMGTGCQSVTRVHTEGTDLVVGVWENGRIGTYRGIREGRRNYGALVFGKKGIAEGGKKDGYRHMLVEIVKFFKTGKPPVTAEETVEIMAFIEAADESKRNGGCSVSIESVMEKARKEIAARN